MNSPSKFILKEVYPYPFSSFIETNLEMSFFHFSLELIGGEDNLCIDW